MGFEPTRAFALPVFKTGAINRSTTPPVAQRNYPARRAIGKELRLDFTPHMFM